MALIQLIIGLHVMLDIIIALLDVHNEVYVLIIQLLLHSQQPMYTKFFI